jgi:septal ring-binding cell division protein DamX
VTYPFPRDAQGRIIVGPLLATDGLDDTPKQAPEPILQTAPVGTPLPPKPAPRRAGDMPTPFGSPRASQQPDTAASTPQWRVWLAGGLVVALVLLAAFALTREPAATDEATPAPTTEVAPVAAATAAPATTPPPTLGRAVVAYDEPNGNSVGALDPSERYELLEEREGWRRLRLASGAEWWVRGWEMDGIAPPTATPLSTVAPAPTARPLQVIPSGPPTTCVPVFDGDNNNAYLGDACGVTSEERQQRALELLAAATPFTP